MSRLEDLPTPVLSRVVSYLPHCDIISMLATSSTMYGKIEELECYIKRRLQLKVVVFTDRDFFENFVNTVKFSPFSNFEFLFDPLEDAHLNTFLSRHGNKIVRLKLPSVYLFMEKTEKRFYEKMPLLEELVVDRIKLWRTGSPIILPTQKAIKETQIGNVPINTSSLPSTFEKVRKFQFENACEPTIVSMFLMGLPKLQILRMGDVDRNHFCNEWTEQIAGNNETLTLGKYLEFRSSIEKGKSLRVLRLGNEMQYAESITDQEIAKLVRNINKQQTILQNVTCTFLSLVLASNDLEEEEKQMFLGSVDHLIDFSPALSGLFFRSLKSLQCVMGNVEFSNFTKDFHPPNTINWNVLEFLALKLGFINEFNEGIEAPVRHFLTFVFGVTRPTVKCVQFEFFTEDEALHRIVNPLAIAQTFPSMESLTVKVPFFTSRNYADLLQQVAENAMQLKFLYLAISRRISSRAFLGRDSNMYTIFKIKQLRHLLISYHPPREYAKLLEEDTNIDLMRDVISQIPLSCLKISCPRKENIFKKTPERALAFLNGPIGNSLVYLDWKSTNDQDVEVYKLLAERVQKNRKSVVFPPSDKLVGRLCINCNHDLADANDVDKFHAPKFY